MNGLIISSQLDFISVFLRRPFDPRLFSIWRFFSKMKQFPNSVFLELFKYMHPSQKLLSNWKELSLCKNMCHVCSGGLKFGFCLIWWIARNVIVPKMLKVQVIKQAMDFISTGWEQRQCCVKFYLQQIGLNNCGGLFERRSLVYFGIKTTIMSTSNWQQSSLKIIGLIYNQI